jgi:replicative DNA helicase
VATNIQHCLISRVIQDKDFHSLEKMQINEEYFSSREVAQVFRYIRDIYHSPETAGEVPSLAMVQLKYPAFAFHPSDDSVPLLASKLREEKIRAELLNLSSILEQEAQTNPAAAMATLKTQVSRLSALAEVGEDLSIAGAYQMLLSQYETVQDSGGIIGIPYPWHPLNEETQGMQGGQFIVLYGRPKSMKTWVAIDIAVHAYLHARRRVLFYTREMSPRMVAQRVAARMARVDYGKFKNGKLQPEVKKRVFENLQMLIDDEKIAGTDGHQPFFVITTDRSSNGGKGSGGVSWLQSKIRDLKPDLVIVDGMYLMRDDRSGQRTVDWKAVAHISQDLKLTAQEFDIPLIGVTQANRAAEKAKGEDLTELAFSDSLGQDADAVIRVTRHASVDQETKFHRTELHLNFPGLREGRLDGIVIHGQPATDFSFIRSIISADEQTKEKEYTPKSSGYSNGVATFSNPGARRAGL